MHPLTQKIIDRSPDRLRLPVTALVRTADGAVANRLPGLAAEIAFWVLLSLPSLLLTVIAAAGQFIDGQAWQDQLIDRVEEVASVALTAQTIESVVTVLEELIVGSSPGLVSFAFIAAVWTASRAVRVVLTTIAIVSRRGNPRRGWHDRLLGFAVTLGTLAIGGVLAPLLVAGPNFGDQLVEWIGTADLAFLADLWRQAYWPTVILLATFALAVLYHLGIPGRSRWRHDWPGAAVATAVWLAGSAGLRLYGIWILDGDTPYGPLAGPIVGLLWLWLTGFAVLLGAELNAQIGRLFPSDTEQPPLDAAAHDDTTHDDTPDQHAAERGAPADPSLPRVQDPDRTATFARSDPRDDRTEVIDTGERGDATARPGSRALRQPADPADQSRARRR